jgi:hypothetical protein
MGKDTKRPTAHTRRATEIDQSTVTLTFSEDVLRAMRRLEATVHDSAHFSPEILENLQHYASGKPLRVDSALSGMVRITREAMKHIHATGDKLAEKAFDEFTIQIMAALGDEPQTIMLSRTAGRHR